MSPRSSSSSSSSAESEGESGKAHTTNMPPRSKTSVNRALREAFSPDRDIYDRLEPTTNGKRRRDDDYRSDRYRSDNRRSGTNHQPSSRYNDLDRRDSSHFDDRSRYDRKRRRTRSPSPGRHRSRDRHSRKEDQASSRQVHFKVQSVTERDKPVSDAQPKSLNAETAVTKAEQAPVETLSIEERRLRREAIRAKYKDQTNSLLVKALDGASPSNSAPSTPGMEPSVSSPEVIAVTSDAELANNNAPISNGDEPSAADYDPTMDMQEDREKRSAQYDDVKDDSKDILLPQSAEKPKKKDGDMFASDDEDDMFAPVQSKPITAVPLKQAKTLDQSLLDTWDDPEGYYRFILNELIDGRYKVEAQLGKGVFANVIRALDTTDNHEVAIKIVRNNETMIKAGAKEMQILQKLADADPEGKKHLVRLERSFSHKGHLCMVFESLDINLREVLKKFGRDVGLNLKAVRAYAQQMFLSLKLLRDCNIVHADLKPDNILVSSDRSQLKICDLGSAADVSEVENEITPYLVSRFYRAPEVILGAPYDYAIDMWSIGCTLFELYTGKILFTGRSNNQMLRTIMECRGKFSLKMLKKAEFGGVHFDDINLNFRSMEKDRITGKDVTRLINFVKPVKSLEQRLFAVAETGLGAGKRLPEDEAKELRLFADLLDKCLMLNPEKRVHPKDALIHPFIYRPQTGLTLNKKT